MFMSRSLFLFIIVRTLRSLHPYPLRRPRLASDHLAFSYWYALRRRSTTQG